MKRSREESPDIGGSLDGEYKRQVTLLNKAFCNWVESNYKAYAHHLKQRFCLKGNLLSFGSGDCGQLGHGVEEESDLSVSRPRIIQSIQDVLFRASTAGGLHNLAIAENGEVWSWGCADNDVLGRDGDENYPNIVSSISTVKVVQVSAGDCHSAALSVNGTVFIWGTYLDKDGRKWFDKGKGGDHSFQATQKEPQKVEKLIGKHGGVVQIASGANHTIALCADGHVYSWGIGETGQLGRPVCNLKDDRGVYQKDDVYNEHLIPATMRYTFDNSPVDNVRFVSAGAYHSFVICAIGSRVYGTGLNQYAQLGIPATSKPIQTCETVTSLDNLHITSISAGEHFSIALSSSGELYSFGRCDQNQLGVELDEKHKAAGDFLDKPQLIQDELQGKRVINVSCGSSHTIAITEENRVYTWGFGDMNQLGLGKEEDQTLPKAIERFHKSSQVFSPTKVLQGSAGGQHSILLCSKD